jgi:hypothetical protein
MYHQLNFLNRMTTKSYDHYDNLSCRIITGRQLCLLGQLRLLSQRSLPRGRICVEIRCFPNGNNTVSNTNGIVVISCRMEVGAVIPDCDIVLAPLEADLVVVVL